MNTQDPNKTQLAGSAAGAPRADAPGDATRLMTPDPTRVPAPGEAPSPPRVPAPPAVDLGATVLSAPEAEATVLSSEARTRVVGAPATTVVPAAPATTVVPSVPTTVLDRDDAPAVDGIDVMGGPYASPVDLSDLTSAKPMVDLESPVKSTRKKGMPVWGVALIVLAVLLGMGGVGFYTYSQELWGGKTVPAVVGVGQEAATKRLEDAGFKVSVNTEAADSNIGLVLACTPEPGTRAETSGGATITVAVARTIPQVKGLQMTDAKKALNDLGAVNIRIQSVNSDAEAGTVVEVTPSEGSEFKSTDEVVLSVATPYVVPDVVGLTADAAKTAVEKAGLTAKVTYVQSDAAHNYVVGCSPDAGTQASAGETVELNVSSPYPDKVTSLAAYLSSSSKDIAAYLSSEKYSLAYGATLSNGDANAVYKGQSGDTIAFTPNPETGAVSGASTTDVLAAGAPVGGVRYVYAANAAPSGATAETVAGVQAVMADCGLTGLKQTCTADDLAALGHEAQGRHFICAYGETTDCSWVVLIGGAQGTTNVVAMAVPRSHFSALDLSAYNGNPAGYVAYIGLYDDSSVVKKEAPKDETATVDESSEEANANAVAHAG